MIRINLLEVKRRKKAQPIPAHFIISIIVTVAVCVIIGFVWYFLGNKISNLKAEKADKQAQLEALQEKLKEVESYERLVASFKEKAEIIKQLKKNQDIPLRLLDEVSKQLPKGVWLEQLNHSGTKINMNGVAFSNYELVNYVQNLKGSEYLTQVTLIESRKVEIGDVSVYKFRLTFNIKV